MNFKDEVLSHFMDEEGLVTVDRDPSRRSTGNGLLFTGAFYTILHQMRLADGEDVKRFTEAVNACWVGPQDRFQGLLERNNNRPDLEAHDDYIGVVAGSFHLGTGHAGDIYSYGRRHFWSFDNTHPECFTLRTCHLRFPGLVQFYKAACRDKPSCLGALPLAGKILANAYSDTTDIDGKLMTWLMMTVIEQTDYKALVGDAMDVWKRQFRKNYGTLGRMLAPYFGASHPFSKLEIEP